MLSLNPAKPVQPIGVSRHFRAAACVHSVASPNRRFYYSDLFLRFKTLLSSEE